MSDTRPSEQATDASLRRLREYVAATIALVVLIGMVVLLIATFTYLDDTDATWARIKDLLLLVNPLVGVVIGYYFNKVSTEARAESAEATAKTAAAAAQHAEVARDTAQSEANRAQSEAQETKSALVEVTQAAERALTAGDGEAGVLSDAHPAPDSGRAALVAALNHARRVLS